MPQDNILILNIVIPLHPLLNALALLALVGELAAGVELVILVLGDPDRLSCEHGTLHPERARARQQHLTRRGHQLIRHRLVGDGVDDGVVADFEHAVPLDAGVGRAALPQDRLFRRVAHLPRVILVLGHGDAVLVEDCVFVAVDRGVHPEGEHVLVERRHDAGPDVGAPWDGGAGSLVVEGHRRENAGRADFQLDVGGLVEDEGEDVSDSVLVNGQRVGTRALTRSC